VHAGRRVAGLEAAAVVDPGDGLQLGELADQRLGAAGELDRVDLAVGGVARDAHQLLLPLQQAQAHALLRVFDVALAPTPARARSSSVRKYQKAETMAARNSSTAAIGASMATASCSTGVWRRHQRRHQDRGDAFTALRATASGEEKGMVRV
jgi:hypothetical protein